MRGFLHDVGEAARPGLGALQPHEQTQQGHEFCEMIRALNDRFDIRSISRIGRQEGRNGTPSVRAMRTSAPRSSSCGSSPFIVVSPLILTPRRSLQSDTGCPRPHHTGDATADMMEHAAEEQAGLRVRIVVRGLVGSMRDVTKCFDGPGSSPAADGPVTACSRERRTKSREA